MDIPEDEVWLDLLDLTWEVPVWEMLDTREQQRAERFVHTQDRQRFAARRTALRRRLGALLSCPPHAIRYDVEPSGRLSLAAPTHGAALQFSVSSAGSVTLFGFAHRQHLGVDIEAVRPFPELARVAEQVLSSRAQLALNGTPPEHRTALFFTLWTAMEARVKASGLGLAGTDEAAVSSLQIHWQQSWKASQSSTEKTFRLALATSGTKPRVHCRVSASLQLEQLFDLDQFTRG